jgi:hypothetical protein
MVTSITRNVAFKFHLFWLLNLVIFFTKFLYFFQVIYITFIYGTKSAQISTQQKNSQIKQQSDYTSLIIYTITYLHRTFIILLEILQTLLPVIIIVYNQASPSDEVMQIMKRVMSVRSEEKFRNGNVTFLLYIYGNASIKDTLIEEWFITKIQDAELEDGTSSRCLAMRRECKEALNVISMYGNNCPIVLPAITLTIFSGCLTSRK